MYAIFLPHKFVVTHDLFEYLISKKENEGKKVILYPLRHFSVFMYSLPKVWLHENTLYRKREKVTLHPYCVLM